MYLSEIRIKNFRCFDESCHVISFNEGLTVLVGENDSGKSAVIDAIRIVLGTTDYEWIRITPDDFHNEDTSADILIVCKFSKLTTKEQASFLECLTCEENTPCLYLHWTCKYLRNFMPPRSSSFLSSGKDGNGPPPAPEARELIRVTYLRPLRDAHSEMRSGRNSRLAQIIRNLSGADCGVDRYVEGQEFKDLSLVGIANLSNDLLANNQYLGSINERLTEILNDQFLLTQDTLTTKLSVAGVENRDEQKIMALLEKLDLAVNKQESSMRGQVGLGTSNIMSMACELLLYDNNNNNKETQRSSFLLIEEPEAHVHAQRQLKVIQALERDAEKGSHQIIITTHSPLLASVVKLSNIVMLKNGTPYSMAAGNTKLNEDDYRYLEKYLDATKANLFFARSVLIVEGPSEELLLPTIAGLIGKSFTDYGTSIVNVRGTGLRRYANIFQRENSEHGLDIRVGCITDRDIMPNCAPMICIDEEYGDETKWPEKRRWRVENDFTEEEKAEYISAIIAKADGQSVKTFVSDRWTLEYDLAYKGLKDEEMKKILIHSLVTASDLNGKQPDKKEEAITAMIDCLGTEEEKAATFYKFFRKGITSKAEFSQQLAMELEEKYCSRGDVLRELLPSYLVEAIDYVVGTTT